MLRTWCPGLLGQFHSFSTWICSACWGLCCWAINVCCQCGCVCAPAPRMGEECGENPSLQLCCGHCFLHFIPSPAGISNGNVFPRAGLSWQNLTFGFPLSLRPRWALREGLVPCTVGIFSSPPNEEPVSFNLLMWLVQGLGAYCNHVPGMGEGPGCLKPPLWMRWSWCHPAQDEGRRELTG